MRYGASVPPREPWQATRVVLLADDMLRWSIALTLPLALAMAGCASLWGIGDLPSLVTDGGVDAAIDAPVDAGPRFCSTLTPKPDFCADFDDESEPLLAGFDNGQASPDPFMTGGATIEDGRTTFFSGPRAATITVPALIDPHKAAAGLVRSFAAPPKSLLLEFAMRIETEEFPDPSRNIGLVLLTFPKGQIAIFRDSGGIFLGMTDDVASEKKAKSTVAVPVGQWKRIGLVVVDRDTDHGTVAMEVDGTQAAELPLGTIFVSEVGRTYLGIGALGATGNLGVFKVAVDNVWMNLR